MIFFFFIDNHVTLTFNAKYNVYILRENILEPTSKIQKIKLFKYLQGLSQNSSGTNAAIKIVIVQVINITSIFDILRPDNRPTKGLM